MVNDLGGDGWRHYWHGHQHSYLVVSDDDKVHTYRDATCLHEEHIINLIVTCPASLYINIDADDGGHRGIYNEDGGCLTIDLSSISQPQLLPFYICVDVNAIAKQRKSHSTSTSTLT